MGEVRFKIYEANPRQPTFMEVIRGKWPKDITIILTAGTPDLLDALIKLLMGIGGCK